MAILNASMRTNLLSLQNTQKLMDATQQRLSTGLKVNNAIDNPNSYFTASNLNNRASDLNALLDNMGQAVQTIKAADEGIKSITTLVQSAKSQANTAATDKSSSYTAKGTFDTITAGTAGTVDIKVNGGTAATLTLATGDDLDAVVTKLNAVLDTASGTTGGLVASNDGGKLKITSTDGKAYSVTTTAGTASNVGGLDIAGTADNSIVAAAEKSFNELLTQIDQLAGDASYKGVNLLSGDDLSVIFNEDRSSSINVAGVDASTTGLALEVADFSSAASIQASINQADAAIKNLRTMSSDFSNAYSIVQNREEFTENLVNVLEEGAGKLVDADMNEEAANMLALQTRQQLGVNALSLASQSEQSVLKLF